MVRLELTLAEARQLQHWLTDVHPPLQENPCLKHVPTKLAEALGDATQRHQCPVCQQWFTRALSGRTGRYCSVACKQKAYRQRQLDSRKQFGPPRRT
jgi:hypothetical protein